MKSSAPVQTTSANPAGNTSAEAIRDAEAFVIAAEATEAPAPASAMNIPAKKPSISYETPEVPPFFCPSPHNFLQSVSMQS